MSNVKSADIIIETYSQELSKKQLAIGRLNAQLYTTVMKNNQLQKQVKALKAKNKPKTKKRGSTK